MYTDAPNHVVDAANGVRYAYRRCGPSGSQPPLLMLHHFRGTLDSWDPALVNALATERDVIAFDNAGVGLSTGRTPRTIAETAVDTLAFMTAIGVRQADLLGFSMGGYTAQELALLRPAAVRRLVLAATAPRGGPGVPGRPDDVFARADVDQPSLEDYLYAFFNHTESSQRSGLEFLGRYIEREHDRDLPAGRAARQAQYQAMTEWGVPEHGALRRLSAIRQPALVVHGDNDFVIPPGASRLLAGLLPDARVRTYPDSGHGFLFQHHEEVARDVLAFLAEAP
ncbi:alpha/beta hydrolase [Streptomyces corchorusii]|uniref:Alpha/beta hydrolase n=2 Tax=Streptomyces TaxID=1883 RepID=A0A101PV54_STRCK|nr:alpha/beta hydrolase [Streptomyces corchorusii]AEY86081.1 alpha/beta hydrolase fold protein [Streptomyces hygroscopicus subsp. jinggangensis 5008]AGF60303.1 alpha/beta hydrolase fold protein [Streptomyces hygroscopicus subsp. jinggangensis TL01]KUN18250.1 alpha/beta hydrolase [Streptomyces corchorusii]